MERLIHSSHLRLKTHLKPADPITRQVTIRNVLSRGNSTQLIPSRKFCSISDPSLSFSSRPRLFIQCSPANLTWRSLPDSRRVPESVPQQRKNFSAAVVCVLFLSALVAIFIQPFTALPAFAVGDTIAKSSNPVASAARGKIFRSELLSSAWTGFFAGCLHTLSGPDHLAALAPLSIGRTRMESAIVGALWGCGHDAGQLIFGLLFLLLRDKLHIEVIRTWGTRIVGFTLLVIGALGIKEALEASEAPIMMENGEANAIVNETVERAGPGKKKIGVATFATGIVHGLQPDALMMILPALALPSRVAGAAFLGMFLIGTVVAMGSYTAFIGSCSEVLKERIPRITEKLIWISSLAAIALGVVILISQLFGFSLY